MASRNTTQKHSASKTSAASKRGKQRAEQQAKHAQEDLSRTKKDLLGLLFAVLGLALFVAVVAPGNGVLTNEVSNALFLAFGLGAYLFSFIFILISATFFITATRTHWWRFGLGFTLIVFSLMCILALFTPIEGNLDNFFATANLTSRGGYVGAFFASLLYKYLGQAIGCIILVGLIIAGLVIIGFSISKSVAKAQAAAAMLRVKSKDAAHLKAARQELHKDTGVEAAADALLDTPQEEVISAGEDTDVFAGPTVLFQGTDGVLYAPDGSAPFEINAPAQDEDAVTGEEISQDGTDPIQATEDPVEANASAEATGAEERDEASAATVSSGDETEADADADADAFVLPPFSLLNQTKCVAKTSEADTARTATALQATLHDFGLSATVVGWTIGPTVTLFKLEMPSGVRLNKITALQDDIALALAADAVRIFAPIPGTSFVGVEVPNASRASVKVADVLKESSGKPLELAIGKNVEGEAILANLAEMPHLLIGGTTGSGKSVAINSMIVSILMQARPDEVRLILIDPKRVELSLYNGIPHLYVPVVTEPKEASAALAWAVVEMERRLKVFQKAGVRNIAGFNEMVDSGELDDDTQEKLPMIVIVIDELADLMMTSGKEVENSISRLAQLARAAGIHLIVATQRPSTNVVTGLIKANITNRIAFNVATNIDSRVILDTTGAEKLIGLGDMLFSRPEWSKPKRLQGCFVSEKEIEAIVSYLINLATPTYHEEILQTEQAGTGASGGSAGPLDPYVWDAADAVVISGLGSTSMLQRKLQVGYARAGRIMDQLENLGIVGPPDGSKPREVLVGVDELCTIRAYEEMD